MKKKKTINDQNCIPIVADGAIATPDAGDGRLIPVLVLDCKNHHDFLNLIFIHEHTLPGDAACTWAVRRFNSRYAYLFLSFTNPAEVEVVIKFDLQKQSVLADGIVQARGVYLQPSESGRRVIEGLDSPKIMVEIPAPTKLNNWDGILIKQLTKRLIKSGLRKKAAASAAQEHLKRMREIWGKRMKNA